MGDLAPDQNLGGGVVLWNNIAEDKGLFKAGRERFLHWRDDLNPYEKASIFRFTSRVRLSTMSLFSERYF